MSATSPANSRGPTPLPPGHQANSNGNFPDIQNGDTRGDLVTPPPLSREQVVMTPKSKAANTTVILIERKLVAEINDRVHVAGGDHRGIIINKDTLQTQKSAKVAAQLNLEFRVFLVSSNTGKHSQESRTLRFWFRDWLKDTDKQAHVAQDFFRELVSPKEFPRDYVGFIKKVMKLMQKGYDEIQSLEIELKILAEISAPPSRPLSMEDSQFEICQLTPEKILELIEQAYPNPITAEDLAKNHGWNEEEVQQILLSLKSRGLIKAMEYNSYMRTHHEDKEVKVVKQMPTIASNKQPTIAVITAQYCEKLAVDAMLENKETFVRYTTVDSEEISELDNFLERNQNPLKGQRKRRYFGESNVYTLGNVGAHRIVTTKLPSVGSTRVAMTAAGNTTTRLLGTFQKVDYVFVVGVAGGVPHYTDYKRHVRLGDVVVSCAAQPKWTTHDKTANRPYIYMYRSGEEVRTYYPQNDCLQQITEWMQTQSLNKKPWDNYIADGILSLAKKTNNDFNRPSSQTDKLYMNIGNREVIEVAHPQPLSDVDLHLSTRLHLGPIGSGRDLVQSDSLRSEFAKKNGLLATDVEMSSVLDSIIGNCRESFILIKGIADYKDGMSNKKWQNYASVAAAAVMKSIICGMDAPTNV